MAEALAEMQREFGLREDIKLKVEATSMQPDSKRIEVEVGDKDGELRTVYKCNTTAAELKRLKYTGYQGGFETFGEPAVSKTDIAHVEGEDGSSGSYLIKKLEVSFGAGGYRQKIGLGPTASTWWARGGQVRQALQELYRSGEELYAKVCEATAVDVRPLDGTAEILGVPLQADTQGGGLVVFPKAGRWAAW